MSGNPLHTAAAADRARALLSGPDGGVVTQRTANPLTLGRIPDRFAVYRPSGGHAVVPGWASDCELSRPAGERVLAAGGPPGQPLRHAATGRGRVM